MPHGELLGSLTPKVELQETEGGYEIQSPSYSLCFHEDSPYIDISDATGQLWIQAFKGSAITTSQRADVTYEFNPLRHEVRDDGSIIVRIGSQNETDTFKEQVWICRSEFIETFVVTEAEGSLQKITLLGGVSVAPNMFGSSVSQRHFNSVYNPQPSEMERPAISALESTRITTSGMWKPGRRREFLITPSSYGFNLSEPETDGALPKGNWLMASLSAPIEHQDMIDYRYEVQEDGFSLEVTYDSVAMPGPLITSPSLLLHFASDPAQGLEDFKRHSLFAGHMGPEQIPPVPDWHRGTTFVSWGHQLERERALRGQGVSVHARDTITEPFVTKALETLSAHDIPIDKIVLDDKWQAEYGTNTPDLEKWPDMHRFTNMQHEIGRRVLLWIKLFDPEGIPPELCIVDAHGRPISTDPTNPAYLELLRQQVQVMLSPTRMDADGLKLDFIAQLPHGPGLRWHGKKRGLAALHDIMKAVHDEALSAKKDALIEAQVVNPWFADTLHQVRLNDTNERHSVTRTMGERARLALTLLPGYPIDPDGWPMSDKESWLEYIRIQPELTGTVTTHFSESVNGVLLTDDDFAALRTAAKQARVHFT